MAIDTSASISGAELAQFSIEVQNIAASYNSKVTVIECDAKIQNVYRLNRGMIPSRFKGRGGTDFRPVFEYVDEHRFLIDVLVYLTDLCGRFPVRKPRFPVIWVCLPQYHVQKVPFGRLVQIQGAQQ